MKTMIYHTIVSQNVVNYKNRTYLYIYIYIYIYMKNKFSEIFIHSKEKSIDEDMVSFNILYNIIYLLHSYTKMPTHHWFKSCSEQML